MTMNEIIMQLVLLEEHPAMPKGFQPTFQKVIEFISEMPEIIRCKDCKYSDMTSNGLVKYCDIWFPDDQLYQDGDYYCADAELRGDSDDR